MNELNEHLIKLCYAADEYYYYGNKTYEESYNYIEQLINNIDSIQDINIKYLIQNINVYRKTCKTININGIHVYMNDNTVKNIIKLLYLRELSKHEINNNPITLHIYFDNRYDSISKETLDNMIPFLHIFDKRYIHIYNDQWFTNNLYDYFAENNFTILYEIESLKDIHGEKENIHFCVTDSNILDVDTYIKNCRDNSSCKKMYISPNINDSKNRNIYRKNIESLISKYVTKDFYLIFEDYLSGQHVGIDRDNKVFLKENIRHIIFDNFSLEDMIKEMKLYLISESRIEKECVDCDECILCALGISDKDCDKKIL